MHRSRKEAFDNRHEFPQQAFSSASKDTFSNHLKENSYERQLRSNVKGVASMPIHREENTKQRFSSDFNSFTESFSTETPMIESNYKMHIPVAESALFSKQPARNESDTDLRATIQKSGKRYQDIPSGPSFPVSNNYGHANAAHYKENSLDSSEGHKRVVNLSRNEFMEADKKTEMLNGE